MINIFLLIFGAIFVVWVVKLHLKVKRNEKLISKLAEGLELCGVAGKEFDLALKNMVEDYLKFQTSTAKFATIVADFMKKTQQNKIQESFVVKKDEGKLN